MLISDIRQRAFAALIPPPRLWLSDRIAYLSSREACATPRRKDNGRWCVVLIRADGSEREIGDFASDSEAWHWINTNAGKQISDP